MKYTIGTKVFGDWEIKKEIGAGGFGVVYEIEKNNYGILVKSALKVIRIPASKSEIKTALSEGMDEDSIISYFEGCVDEIVKEIAVMSSLKNHPNIVTYEDHHVERDTEEFGWYILIRMELLTPLQDYQLSHNMTEKEIVQMARDICNALVYCQQKQIIHRDIKPENIFINELGEYKLGDFGVARSLDKTKGGLSVKGTIGYMAPEVYLGKPYGVSVDTYSVGLMMYRMLNGNRMPFFPPAPQPITYQDKENAMVRRMQGDAFPRPLYGSELLKDVILKACAYNSSDRYRTAWEMLDALNRCGQQSYTQQAEKVEIEEEPKAIKKPVMRYEKEKEGIVGLWNDSKKINEEEVENGLGDDLTKILEEEQENLITDEEIEKKEKSGIWKSFKIFAIGGILIVFALICCTFIKSPKKQKYEYILANYNNINAQTYKYLVELKEQGYGDAEELYEDLYGLKVEIFANKEEYNFKEDENNYKPGDIIYFNVCLEGGYPGEEIPMKAVIKSGGEESIVKWDYLWKNDEYGWVSHRVSEDFRGAIKCEIMGDNSFLGEKTVYVK